MRKLKLFFACLLMAVLSIGQMWGKAGDELATCGGTGSGYGTRRTLTDSHSVGWVLSTGQSGYLGTNNATNHGKVVPTDADLPVVKAAKSDATTSTTGYYFYYTSTAISNVGSIVFSHTATNSNASATVYVVSSTTAASKNSANWSKVTLASGTGLSAQGADVKNSNGGTYTFQLSATQTSAQYYGIIIAVSGAQRFTAGTITIKEGATGSGSSEPTVSADPESVTNVAFAGVTNQTIDLTYENITGYETEATVHPNADGTGTLSPAWLTASVSDADDYATITYSVTANTGAARTAYIKVYTTDGDKEAETIIPVSQVKYSAPTGTFNKFTGSTLTEGDYVITYGAYALKSRVASNRWINGSIENGASSLVNPEDSIVWHISASGDYWLLYNAAIEKYAAGTSSKNQGSLIAMPQGGASNLMKWIFTKTDGVATYQFENYGRSQASSDSGNKWLRQNGNNGWATYASGTGGALTLYKKAGTPKAVTIDNTIENGSVGVTGAADLSAVAEGTELTLSNTPDDGYKLTAYDVYKTGETATKVTVTNGKFTMPDYDVTVSATFEVAKVLTSIEITNPATQTTFWQGETFNYDGLEVTAHFEGAADEVVTPASVTGSTATAGNAITVTVSYSEGGDPETTTYNIVVKAIPNTAETAYSVADARDIINKLGTTSGMYITGIISQIDSYSTEYKSITYWISDDGSTTNQLQVYSGKDFGGADFVAKEDLEEGQTVTVVGELKLHSTTYEFNYNNQIVSRPKVLKSIALGGSYPTEFTQGDAFSSEGLIVTASYNYGADATVTPNSITGYNMSATGNQTVTVSYTEAGVTKTATYGISVAAPDLCEHKATISKGAEVNGTFSLSVSGEQCLDELEGYKTSTVLTATPAEHYHLSEVTATVGTVGTIADNECTISDIDASTTITAVFVENDKVTVKFAMGTESATGDVPADVANKYAGQSVTLPANPFTYTGEPLKVFGGWKHSLTNEVKQPGSYTITAADAAEDNITFTAVWNDLSPWATVYTNNVTLTGSQNVNVTITVDEEDTNFAGVKMNKGAAATFTIPAGTTHLYAHMAAWNGEGQTVTVSGDCFDEPKGISITADAAISGSGTTFDIDDAKAPLDYFKEIILDNEVTEPTVVTITAASGKRFVLFGVNATYPAAIALDPTSKNFGEVKENANAQFEFTITPNAMSTGDLVASIIGTDAAKFSVGAISENKVTVTFTPGEVGGPYSASLKVESGNAEVTAALSGTGITALTPEIGIDKDEVAFGNVEQNSTPATQSVAVTLSNIDEDGVSAAITGSAFTLSTNKLTANGSIVITPVTTTPGVYSETLTLSATGATSKTVTVTMTVVDEWAYVYTSNVTISSDVDAKVTINEVNYDAVKANKGSSATTITLPQGVTKIHMHLVAWKGEAQTVTISGDCFDEDKEIDIIANDGVSGSGTTYPLGASGVDYYCSLTPDKAVAANTEITIATEGQKRFVLFGVNQVGGIVPVLDHITVSGDLTTKSGYKTGDDLDLDGLTVEAVYTLGGVAQTPVDITDKLGDGLTLTYDPLVVDQTEVTITATYEGKSDDIVITLDEAVVSGDPVIITDVSSRSWTSVSQYTTPATKTVTVTLKNVAAATATLGGTNPEVFSIDKTALVNGDVITISVNTETAGNFAATLTISDNATENPAEDKVVSLSLTVTEAELPEATVGTFTRWIPATEIKDGMEVLIVGVNNTDYYAMGVQTNNNRTAVQGSVVDGVFSPGANTMSFTLVAQGDGTYAIRTSTGKYLYAAASGNNYLRTQAAVDDNAKWTLSLTSAVAESSSNRNVMQFNSGSTIFSCYASASQKPIQFYVRKADYTRDVTEGRIGTICLPKAGKMEGVSLFQISYMDYEGDGVTPHKIYFDELPSNEMIAGRPYIFLPNEGASKLGVYYTSDETASAGHLNGLYGTLTEMNTANSTGDDLWNNFIFSNNLFYLVNSSTVRLQANRAYVKACDELPGWSNPGYVPSLPAPGLRRIGIGGEAPQVTTGMENVQTDDAQTTKVLINGQFFILRGEKMYDATGRLVK